jgi:23S rRNA (uracil1939-C5)-methyltransferase
MTPGGDALGRHDGMVIFVPYGIPGERVDVMLTERKARYARGRIAARHSDAESRVTPVCPHFGVCGGCDWQHIDYAAQLDFKTAAVREQFIRIGKFSDAPVAPCIPSPQPYGYRNHARLVVGRDGLGYRTARSHAVVTVAECPILEPAVTAQLQSPPAAAPGDEVELRSWEQEVVVGVATYQVSPGAFFQANTAVAALLVDAVLAALSLQGDEQVLDLYCGVGLFTLPIAQRCRTVWGVEDNPVAVADALENVARAGVGATIVEATAAETLQLAEISGIAWDAVVVDPPRTGLDRAVTTALCEMRPPVVVYVSCEPATLARDARLLCDGGYRLGSVQPFDMFPQTHHVECVAIFKQ